MAVEVVMPKLGMAMKEGSVSVWNKGVGDSVGKGEPIASVNSEKIEIDVESPAAGTLLKITVAEGEGVPPGTVICYVGNPGEEIGLTASEAKGEMRVQAEEPPTAHEKIESAITVARTQDRVKISPVARKMAESANLMIEAIMGTGPGGRITKEDVLEAMKKSESLQAEPEKENSQSEEKLPEEMQEIPVRGIRKVISQRMFASLQQTAQLTINMKVDVTDLLALQKQSADAVQTRFANKLTITDFIARAVVLSLQEHEQMNSAYIDDKIRQYKHVHLGIAVALENGLVVPVIRNAEGSSLISLSKNIKELARKAREGQATNEEMQGSTFTITSLGAYGVEHFTPVLNPPETGILGVGAFSDTPVYTKGELTKRSILPLSLTFDHRAIDGAPAAAFLKSIKQYLEEPITILL